jgi:hypothetical protein
VDDLIFAIPLVVMLLVLPRLFSVVVSSRDQHLLASLLEVAALSPKSAHQSSRTIVAVVGLLHVNGVVRLFESGIRPDGMPRCISKYTGAPASHHFYGLTCTAPVWCARRLISRCAAGPSGSLSPWESLSRLQGIAGENKAARTSPSYRNRTLRHLNRTGVEVAVHLKLCWVIHNSRGLALGRSSRFWFDVDTRAQRELAKCVVLLTVSAYAEFRKAYLREFKRFGIPHTAVLGFSCSTLPGIHGT